MSNNTFLVVVEFPNGSSGRYSVRSNEALSAMFARIGVPMDTAFQYNGLPKDGSFMAMPGDTFKVVDTRCADMDAPDDVVPEDEGSLGTSIPAPSLPQELSSSQMLGQTPVAPVTPAPGKMVVRLSSHHGDGMNGPVQVDEGMSLPAFLDQHCINGAADCTIRLNWQEVTDPNTVTLNHGDRVAVAPVKIEGAA